MDDFTHQSIFMCFQTCVHFVWQNRSAGRVKMKTKIYLAAINNRVQLYHGISCFISSGPFQQKCLVLNPTHGTTSPMATHGKNQSDLGYPTKWLYQLKRGWGTEEKQTYAQYNRTTYMIPLLDKMLISVRDQNRYGVFFLVLAKACDTFKLQ